MRHYSSLFLLLRVWYICAFSWVAVGILLPHWNGDDKPFAMLPRDIATQDREDVTILTLHFRKWATDTHESGMFLVWARYLRCVPCTDLSVAG